MSFFSGIVDENEHIHLGGYPAPFREMLGLMVEEYVPYQMGTSNSISTIDGELFTNTFWADIIRLKGAESLAKYKEDYYAGSPAVTKHAFGKGMAYYLGTELESAGLVWLFEKVLVDASVNPTLPGIPVGVEVSKRSGQKKEWLFVLNHTGTKIDVNLRKGGIDITTGLKVADKIVLSENEVAIIEQDIP
jgi:beta-galactosidase